MLPKKVVQCFSFLLIALQTLNTFFWSPCMSLVIKYITFSGSIVNKFLLSECVARWWTCSALAPEPWCLWWTATLSASRSETWQSIYTFYWLTRISSTIDLLYWYCATSRTLAWLRAHLLFRLCWRRRLKRYIISNVSLHWHCIGEDKLKTNH